LQMFSKALQRAPAIANGLLRRQVLSTPAMV